MPTFIIQHNNVFNFFTTVSDGCYFKSGLTLEELKEYYKQEYGNKGMEIYNNESTERCLKEQVL